MLSRTIKKGLSRSSQSSGKLLSKLRHREVNDLPTEVEIARCLGRQDESWRVGRVQCKGGKPLGLRSEAARRNSVKAAHRKHNAFNFTRTKFTL